MVELLSWRQSVMPGPLQSECPKEASQPAAILG